MNPSLKYAKFGDLSFPYFYAKNTTHGLHIIGIALLCRLCFMRVFHFLSFIYLVATTADIFTGESFSRARIVGIYSFNVL